MTIYATVVQDLAMEPAAFTDHGSGIEYGDVVADHHRSGVAVVGHTNAPVSGAVQPTISSPQYVLYDPQLDARIETESLTALEDINISRVIRLVKDVYGRFGLFCIGRRSRGRGSWYIGNIGSLLSLGGLFDLLGTC